MRITLQSHSAGFAQLDREMLLNTNKALELNPELHVVDKTYLDAPVKSMISPQRPHKCVLIIRFFLNMNLFPASAVSLFGLKYQLSEV